MKYPFRVFVLAGAISAALPAQQSDVQPDAISALNNMGTYLRTLKAFQVHADSYKEEVLLDGQKIQLASVSDLLAQAPGQLRLEFDSDREDRLYLYDGKIFTLVDTATNYYATVAAPPTIPELINVLQEKYGITLPFADLFRWGGPQSKLDEIKAARNIGPGQVGGTTCEHYASRQPGLDWQIWIQLGNYPLPRKLVLTTMTDEARPQFSATYTWNLAPSFNEATFKFDPPPGASKITIAEAPTGGGDNRR